MKRERASNDEARRGTILQEEPTGTNLQVESIEKRLNEEIQENQFTENNPGNNALLTVERLAILSSKVLSENMKLSVPTVVPPRVKIEKQNPWAIQLIGSANFFDVRYKDSGPSQEPFAAEANESIGALQLGNSFGVHLEYQLNSAWSLLGGIRFENYEHTLNTILVTDTTVLDDAQQLRRAQNIRTVRHHNKLSVLSLPLAISYDQRISNRLSIGGSFGAAYAFVTTQSGRLLGRDKVILDYNQDELKQYTNYFSLQLSPYVRYQMNDRFAIQLNAGASYQSHGNMQGLDLSATSLMYRIGLGLRYKL